MGAGIGPVPDLARPGSPYRRSQQAGDSRTVFDRVILAGTVVHSIGGPVVVGMAGDFNPAVAGGFQDFGIRAEIPRDSVQLTDSVQVSGDAARVGAIHSDITIIGEIQVRASACES